MKTFLLRYPDDWPVDAAAESAGMSVAEFVRDAVRRRLPKEVREGLSEARERGRPKAAKNP